jgi:hypothetical protein
MASPRTSKAVFSFVAITMAAMLAATMESGAKPSVRLSVLTYNTHLLPRIGEIVASHRSLSDYRARAIGTRVAAYDLIGLCEVFDNGYRKSLIDAD